MNRHTRIWIAVVTAFLFVFQVGFTASSSTSTLLTVQTDIFGNPLCVTSHVDRTGEQPFEKHQLPNCCVYCCAAVGGICVPAVSFHAISRPLRSHAVDFPISVANFIPDAEHDPGNPRAPPVPT